MNVKFLKKMSLSLVIFMILLTLPAVSSCANSGNNTNAENDNTSAAETDGDTEEISDNLQTEEPRVLSDAPVIDCGGTDFRILSRESNSSNHHWEAKDIDAEAETGEPINDAVFKRNRAVEEKYNIKIKQIENASPMSLATKAVKANSDDYDAAFGALGDTVGPAQNGILLNLKNVPNLDLPNIWYDQNANAQLSVANKLYFTFCDFTLMDKDSTWVYLFSKTLIKDLGLEDPYKLVKDNKWTIDKLAEMCRSAAKDLDGDGVMGNYDQYGWQGESFNMYAGIIASGIQMLPKNAEDIPEYKGVGEKGMSVFTKLLSVFGDKTISQRSEDITGFADAWKDLMDVSFQQDKILFANVGMNRVTLFRSMDTDFGIIPSPKSEESQPDYYSTVSHYQATCLSIPVTVSEQNKVGAVIDSLCAESRYTVIPAYYDIQLKTKLSRDGESAAMLDIIFANRQFDFGLIYGWGGLSDIFSNAMKKNDANITSSLEKVESRVITAIEKTVKAYEDNLN